MISEAYCNPLCINQNPRRIVSYVHKKHSNIQAHSNCLILNCNGIPTGQMIIYPYDGVEPWSSVHIRQLSCML